MAGTRHEAAFTTLLLVGLRRGELLGLEWSDIDFDANRLTVRQQLRRHDRSRPGEPVFAIEACKTRQSRRTLAMPEPVAQALRRHRTAQLAERLSVPDWEEAPLGRDLVFRNHAGGPLHPDTLRHYCYQITETALGERFSPHDLRHAAASFALEAGVPIPRISEMMGHSSIRVTYDVYSHLFDEGKDDVAEAMGALFAAQT